MPLRFSLRQLEYLVAVGECGSIAMASEKVNVSSPSISAAISQLEQVFGLPLFVRKHAHGLSLTQGGKQFVEQARLVLAEAARLNNLANHITGKVRGPLNVGCLLTFAQIVLPHLRRSFVDQYTEVDFHQFERNQTEIFEGLRQATLDVALTYEPRRVCRRLQLLSRMEHHEQDNEQVFPRSARTRRAAGPRQ